LRIAVRLTSVYRCQSVDFLYELLRERLLNRSLNISHTILPTRTQHLRFVRSKPYRAWYLIKVDRAKVGHIWLNRQNEIGLTLLRAERRKGYEEAALRMLFAKQRPLPAIPSKRSAAFLANVSPHNRDLQRAFESMGGEKIQCTYRFDTAK
jgi:hypothetical protein